MKPCRKGFVKETKTLHKLVGGHKVTVHKTECVPVAGGNTSGGSGGAGGSSGPAPSGPPVADGDSYALAADGTLTIAAPGVLGNDHGSGLAANLISGVSDGNLTLNHDGSFSYTPDPGFTGNDSFTYKDIDASFNSSNTTTVTITVTPLATNATYEATTGTPLDVGSPGVLVGDVGSDLTATLVSNVSHGTLSLGANGSFDYTSTPGFVGDDSFTYTASDPTGSSSNVATVTIAVSAAGAPDVVPQTFSGAVGNTPLQVGGSRGSGPEVYVSDDALDGDSDPNGGTLTTAPGAIPTAQGGTVSMASDGSFTYVPPTGFRGASDSFTYEVDSSEGYSADANATINFATGPDSGPVWYVNDALGAGGDGSSGSPFNSLAAAAAASEPGDTIFLFASATPYAGGIGLVGDQSLDGESAGLSVGGETLLAPSGSAPEVTNASGAGVTLSSGDSLAGVTIANTSGDGVSATNASAFSLLPSVTISDAGGDGLDVSGGAGTIDVAATISGSTHHSVAISGRTGGTATISGSVSDTGQGVSLVNNTGATIDFTGTLDASTAANSAFTATGGGTVEVDGDASTLSTTTGTALDVANTTIGPDGLNFLSIDAGDASSGPAHAIVLSATGNLGGLSVSGSGTAGSGGTIEKATAAGTSDGALSLSGVHSVSLSYLDVEGSAGNGIFADNVATLAITNDAVSGGSEGIVVNGDGSVAEALNIEFNTLSGQSADGIDVDVAGNAQGRVDANAIGTATAGSGSQTGDGIDVTDSANTLTLGVEDNTISQVAEGEGIAGTALASGTLNLTVEGNEVTMGAGTGDGMSYTSSGSGPSTLCLDTAGNTATAGGANAESLEQTGSGSVFVVEGYSGETSNDAAVASFVESVEQSLLTGTNPWAVLANDANSNGFNGGTCATPSGGGGIS